MSIEAAVRPITTPEEVYEGLSRKEEEDPVINTGDGGFPTPEVDEAEGKEKVKESKQSTQREREGRSKRS